MKLLIINPNISHDVTALIESEALRSAAPDTELVARTAGHGVEDIENRIESLIAPGAVAAVIDAFTAPAASSPKSHASSCRDRHHSPVVTPCGRQCTPAP